MSADIPHDGEEAEVLAAEHALGLLDGAERVDAERRYAANRQFAEAVEAWQARFAALLDEVAPVQAPIRVWARIARSLDQAANVVEFKLRRSLMVWRGATAAAATVAVALGAVLLAPRPQPPAPPILTAKLAATANGPAVFIAYYDPARQAIVLTPATATAPPDHSPQLWLMPTGGKPISLGVGTFTAPAQLVQAKGLLGAGAMQLGVSLEPKGGSPTGQPTGPVIATGPLQRL
jgi:anti-sigma-K factor RskA